MWAHKNMVVTMRANIIIQLMCEEQHMHIEMVWNIEHAMVQFALLFRALLLDEL